MRYLFLFVGLFVSDLLLAQPETKINCVGLLSGSYMRTTPASFSSTNLMGGAIRPYAPEALFDQSAKIWRSREKADFPFVFVQELTEDFEITELRFDNRIETAKSAAKSVEVAFSTDLKNTSFKTVGNFELEPNKVNLFTIEPSVARLIKITITANHGNKKFTEMAEFEAYGKTVLGELLTIDVNGTWQSNWGNVTFSQNGNSVGGNYVFNRGIIKYGGINRNQLTYNWVEKVINRQGLTLMFMNKEGNRLTGIWCYDADWANYGFWILERNKMSPIKPYQAQQTNLNTEEKKIDRAVVAEMAKELKETKKLILYGINFKNNSVEIQEGSQSVLNQVVQILSENASLNIRVEGHTDDVGSDSYNQELSDKRALSVKAYLVEVGKINESRITTIGLGESKPIANNATEMGKAANRRVEIHQTN